MTRTPPVKWIARMPVMQGIKAQRASILEPHDHLHNNHDRVFVLGLQGA
jgi:hypothetical protein